MYIESNSVTNVFEQQRSLQIELDGEVVLVFEEGKCVDNVLTRNFSDCYDIVDALRRAYAAGRAGEGLTVVERREDVTEIRKAEKVEKAEKAEDSPAPSGFNRVAVDRLK